MKICNRCGKEKRDVFKYEAEIHRRLQPHYVLGNLMKLVVMLLKDMGVTFV